MSTVNVRFASRRRVVKMQVAGVPNYHMLHRAIVGLKIAGRPALNFPSHLRWGADLRFDDRQLPLEMALRLEKFMRIHYIDGVQDFNCFTFMRYVTGLHSQTSGIKVPHVHYTGVAANPERISAGKPYIMVSGGLDGVRMHGAVGFTRTICLSVIGDNQPVTWAPTSGLMKAYGADTLMEVHTLTYL